MITLYTMDKCPKCKILKKKLEEIDATFNICNDEEEQKNKGFDYLPVMELNGEYYSFGDAVKLINQSDLESEND